MAEGKLDKHGRPNENTPKEYLRSLPDLGAPSQAATPAKTDAGERGAVAFGVQVSKLKGAGLNGCQFPSLGLDVGLELET